MHTSVSGAVTKKCGVCGKSDSNREEMNAAGSLALFFLPLPFTLTVSGGIDI